MKVIAAFVFLFAVPVFSHTQNLEIDQDHSDISFGVKHLMVSKVNGNFKNFSGTITMDEHDVKKDSVNVNIKVDSIDTRRDKRDEHLKSPDFFDADKFKEITFKSTKVSGSDKKLKVEGLLTMHGVEKPVTLDAVVGGTQKDSGGKTHMGFSATGKIKRSDFGLKWNKALETGGVMVGDEVTLNFEIEAVETKVEGGDQGAKKN